MQTNLSLMLTNALGALLLACAASPRSGATAPSSASTSAGSNTAELIRSSWNFDDPKQSEQRFRVLSEQALARGDTASALELTTQVARAQGLDQRFAEATATLDGVAAKLDGQPAVVRVRVRLEQGRVLNSSDQPEPARPLFLQALELAQAAHLDALAVDAAHMVAITFLSQLGGEVLTNATLGLLIGGVLAAPFGAWLAKRIPARALLALVGTVLVATSAYGIWKALS